MSNLNGGAIFKAYLRRLETTDPKHPDTWNPNYQDLINNDVYLKQFADEVAAARGGRSSIDVRMDELEGVQAGMGVDYANAEAAALKFALDQSAIANRSVQALKQQLQQEGEITISNRGVVSGCSLTKSTTAARNLNIIGGRAFAFGRRYPVVDATNAASVPSNIGSGNATVTAYLYQGGDDAWKLAVTAIGQGVPPGAITLYSIVIPPNSTDATDPNLTNVTLTDVRRIEAQFPLLLDSPATVSVALNTLSANDYRLSFDVIAASGAPCEEKCIVPTSLATNGFTVQLASAADNVNVRWHASKLNN